MWLPSRLPCLVFLVPVAACLLASLRTPLPSLLSCSPDENTVDVSAMSHVLPTFCLMVFFLSVLFGYFPVTYFIALKSSFVLASNPLFSQRTKFFVSLYILYPIISM